MEISAILFLIGRILFGGFFIMNGINHFTKNAGMSQYAASKGVPSPSFAVYLSGLMILLGGLGILLGVYTQISLWLIIAFLVIISFKMHNFWTIGDESKMPEQIQFMKNMALLGAALMMLGMSEPWIWSASGWLGL